MAGRTVLIANPSADVYGSDLQLLESVSALTAAGYRVLVTVPGDGPLLPRLRERGAEVQFLDYPVLRKAHLAPLRLLGLAGSAASALPRLIRLLRASAPAALYVNTVTLPWWLLAGRLSGVRTVCHVHEAEEPSSRLVGRALFAPLRLADHVIVVSRTALAAIGTSARPGRTTVIYNGVPQPEEPVTPAVPGLPVHAVCVGRLSARKAPHVALEAVALLRARGYDLHLELVGTVFGGNEAYEQQLRDRSAQPDLAGAISFAGYCSPIWPRLAAAQLAIQPSQNESLGNAVIEAQYALRPVVATDVSGHRESIVDLQTGLLVPPDDPEALAAAIARLIDDPALAGRIAQAARASAVQKFSVERYAAELVDFFEGFTR
jgi:glycosyltransferase involved in cell wall biosynthesis